MPDGEFGQTLKTWIETLEGIEGEIDPEQKGQLQSTAYSLYLRYLELIARLYPELTDYEKQTLAMRQAEQDWQKQKFGLQQQTEQARLTWQQQQARIEQEQAWLPYQQMTAYQQAQMQLSQMQQAAQLAGLGEEGWIQQWYAQQAQQAQFKAPPKPWFTAGAGLAGIAGWEQMKPEERGEWMRRFEHSQWARLDPSVQAQVQAGWGFPQAAPGEQISLGEPSTQPWGGEREVIIKPSGEIDIKGMPMTGQAAYQQGGVEPKTGVSPTRPHPRGPSGDFQAPPFAVGEAPPRRGGEPRPQPTAPPTPEWLPQFAPWLTAGEPITKGQMATPSAQMWAGVSPSVQAGLRGFAKWGGTDRSMEDIYAHMLQMQPEAPWGGRGRWQPARQR